LDKPLAVRLMTAEDVMEIAPLYDKYDFPEGRNLSGHILKEYIQAMKTDVPDDLDFFIDAVLADALHLDEKKNAGVRWMQDAIMCLNNRTMFSRIHIAKLAPLIAKEERLFTCVKFFVNSVVTQDEILNWLFPELPVEKFVSFQKNRTILEEWAPTVELSGSRPGVDGEYCRHHSSGFRNYRRAPGGLRGGQELFFQI
jgi:hypothetical protein